MTDADIATKRMPTTPRVWRYRRALLASALLGVVVGMLLAFGDADMMPGRDANLFSNGVLKPGFAIAACLPCLSPSHR